MTTTSQWGNAPKQQKDTVFMSWRHDLRFHLRSGQFAARDLSLDF